MSEWTCPKCEGGFPQPVKAHGVWNCPWCGKTLAKMLRTPRYDPVDNVVEENDA